MPTLKERFAGKYIPEPNSGCWLWTASIGSTGYGQINVSGSPMKAHRAAWLLFRGEVQEGLCVLHRCDNRLCVNPDHLYCGTHKDNSRDLMERGNPYCWNLRQHFTPSVQARITARLRARIQNMAARGVAHHNAKLTIEQVAAIRDAKGTHAELASQYGVARSTITRIKGGKRWSNYFADAS